MARGAQADATLVIHGDSAGAEKALGAVARGTKAVEDVADRASSGLKRLAGAWLTVEAARKAFQLSQSAAQFEDAKRIFDASGDSLDRLREQTRGMVSDFELVKRANLGRVLGIDADAVAEFAQIAEASARTTGQSFDFLFESIVTGVARGEKEILDNLGIVVSAGKANEEYAKQLGKSATALTDAEKKQAFMNAALSAGRDLVAQAGDASKSAGAAYSQFKADVENLGTAVGTVLNPVMAKLLGYVRGATNELKTFFNNLSREEDLERFNQLQAQFAENVRKGNLELAKGNIGLAESFRSANEILKPKMEELRAKLNGAAAEPAVVKVKVEVDVDDKTPGKVKGKVKEAIEDGEIIEVDIPDTPEFQRAEADASAKRAQVAAERAVRAKALKQEYEDRDAARDKAADAAIKAKEREEKEKLRIAKATARQEAAFKMRIVDEITSFASSQALAAFGTFLDVAQDVAAGQKVVFAEVAASFVRNMGTQIMGIGVRYAAEGAGELAKSLIPGNQVNIPGAVAMLSVGAAITAAGAGMATTGAVGQGLAQRFSGGGGGAARSSAPSQLSPLVSPTGPAAASQGAGGAVVLNFFGGQFLGDPTERATSLARDQRIASRYVYIPATP